MLDRSFRLSENRTTARTELLAGVTTFLTMAYIIFVQPAVLSGKMFGRDTGLDFGAVTTATCLSAAVATAIMALYARYPIAQAPGMGENFFFVFSAIPAAAAAGFANAWQVALGTVFVSGVLFLILSLVGLRELIFNAVSPSLKNGIAAGIGLFIAFIGLQNAGLIVKDPGTAVKMNTHFASPDLLVFFAGLLLTAVLHARKVRGSILWGILGATLLTVAFKLVLPQLPAAISASPLVTDSMLVKRFEIAKAVVAAPPSLAPTFLKFDLFRALSPAMLPFVLALFFSPLIAMIGSYPPITAPALVIVGAMMMQNAAKVDWKDYSEAVPAFLTMIGIPLSYSIADGLALGFISYPVVKALAGRGREIGWLTYLLAAVLVAYFLFIRGRMG